MQSLTIHEHNYHSKKQEFLALKWAIAEQFQEYLLWKPFVVRTNNNPLTYIMTTPNLDATQPWWVESLARFTFSIEYQKGQENVATECPELSHITAGCRNHEVHPRWNHHGYDRKSRCSGPCSSIAWWKLYKQVQETVILVRASQTCINLHVTDWVTAQQEDPMLKTAIEWISNWNV